MKLVVCLDDRRGMMFNDRRQSRDRLLIDDLERLVKDTPVYLTAYSEPLFSKNHINYTVTKDPISEAGKGDYCFVETFDPAPYAERISEIVIYRWNRHYPSDLCFTLDLDAYHLTEST